MSLHLIKLCVGADSIADLAHFQAARLERQAHDGVAQELAHRTRQMPRRRDEILDGGSLYWVISGQIAVRQGILDLRAVSDDPEGKRCDVVLASRLVPVRPTPRRAFQGWRYLAADAAPADLGDGPGQSADIPDELRAVLIELGLM